MATTEQKTPMLAKSPLTNRFYIVTAWAKDGSAKTKYDCTEQIKELIAEAQKPLLKALEAVEWGRDGCCPYCGWEPAHGHG